MKQLQAIRLGACESFLVREDAALAKRLQANTRHETAARVPATLDLEVLMIDVQRAGRVLGQDALPLPVAQAAGGACVAVVVLGVGRRFLVEDQANDVVGAA